MIQSPELTAAARALRDLILAGEHYRQVVAGALLLDISQTQALSYLYSRGDLGQSELGALLGYNTSSMTALVDRLEAQDVARRTPHPTDRRRSIVALTTRGRTLMAELSTSFVRAFDSIEESALPDLAAALSAVAADLRLGADRIAEHGIG